MNSNYENLERKKRELDIREQQLNEKEKSLSRAFGDEIPNWPRCKPLVRHSINEDIPQEGRKIAKRSYLLWQASSLGFALNLAAAIGFKTSKAPGYDGVGGLLLAIVYLVLMPPLSFYFWHLALYRAIKRNSSSRFVMYFINFGIDIGFCIFLVVGLFQGGGGGLIGMIAMFDGGFIAAGAISAICVGYLTIYVLLGCFQLKSVYSFYRSGGHNLENAKTEIVTSVASNSTVQRGAMNALRHS